MKAPKSTGTITPSDIARFMRRINVVGECWIWDGPLYKGYGRFWMGMFYFWNTGKIKYQCTVPAHRASYLAFKGDIPEDKIVCHTCDNPACVNPAHLWLGTFKENTEDMYQKGRAAVGDKNGSRLYPERLRRGTAATASKLSEDQVAEIRKAWVYRKVTLQQLADRHGVAFTTIHKIVIRKIWKHVP